MLPAVHLNQFKQVVNSCNKSTWCDWPWFFPPFFFNHVTTSKCKTMLFDTCKMLNPQSYCYSRLPALSQNTQNNPHSTTSTSKISNNFQFLFQRLRYIKKKKKAPLLFFFLLIIIISNHPSQSLAVFQLATNCSLLCSWMAVNRIYYDYTL